MIYLHKLSLVQSPRRKHTKYFDPSAQLYLFEATRFIWCQSRKQYLLSKQLLFYSAQQLPLFNFKLCSLPIHLIPNICIAFAMNDQCVLITGIVNMTNVQVRCGKAKVSSKPNRTFIGVQNYASNVSLLSCLKS